MRMLRRSVSLLGVALAALGAAAATAVADVDLALEKARLNDAAPVAVGEQAVFRLDVRNLGDTPATGVSVVDTFPDGLTPVEAPRAARSRGGS